MMKKKRKQKNKKKIFFFLLNKKFLLQEKKKEMDRFFIKRNYHVVHPDDEEIKEPKNNNNNKVKKRRVTTIDLKQDNKINENESMFRQPKQFLPFIERLYKEHDKRLTNNPHHLCAKNGGKCGCRPLNVIIYKKNSDFLDGHIPDILRYHICIPELCRHIKPSHVCGGDEKMMSIIDAFIASDKRNEDEDETLVQRKLDMCEKYTKCPHSVSYSEHDTYVFKNLYVCPISGNIHACGLNCSVKFTDIRSGGQHVCPISAVVLGSILHDWRMDSNIFTTRDTDRPDDNGGGNGDDDSEHFDSRDINLNPKKAKGKVLLGDYEYRREITRSTYMRLLLFLYTSVDRQRMEMAAIVALMKKINEKIIDIISKNNDNVHNDILWTLFSGCQVSRYFNFFNMCDEVKELLKKQQQGLFSLGEEEVVEETSNVIKTTTAIEKIIKTSTPMFRAYNIKKIKKTHATVMLQVANNNNNVEKRGDDEEVSQCRSEKNQRIIELLDCDDDDIVAKLKNRHNEFDEFIQKEIEKMCMVAWDVFDRLSVFFSANPDAETGLTIKPMDAFLLPILYLMIDGYSVNIGNQAVYSEIKVPVIPKIAFASWLPCVDSLQSFFQAADARYKVKNITQNQKTIKHMFDVIAVREDSVAKFKYTPITLTHKNFFFL